ncbi:hypothetical protein BU26DRAFT_202868 [Trematosphaeria pertusa]|uniref:Rhodopsin domain-containing protein n=1 Tax=Trematosphaeria pertusa TaxID=390896 RepID=A0A6A6HT22_9PLEO|nr:uncharacterized protein BU26DRAFT_202868 [Trematosphaeria pertusa]KAF2240590.1 hypothetical protein BU26DRAFT_202868 [Trematosphaeria pertusa]
MALTTRQVAVIAVGGVCVLISTLAVLCRALGRRITRTQWQLNDYLMLLAYFFALGFVGTSIAMTTDNYVGAHVADIPSTDLAEVMVHNRQNIIIACLLFTPCTVLVNLSITHFYTRIFPQAWLVRTCKLLMVFYVFYELAAITTCFLLCRPLAGLWDPAITHAKCLDIRMFWTVGSAGCLGFDLTTLALPMPVLWGLRMPDWRKKVRLTVLFGLGVV